MYIQLYLYDIELNTKALSRKLQGITIFKKNERYMSISKFNVIL